MDAAQDSMPQELREAVEREADAQGFDEPAARWLATLIEKDPTLPVPTAGAMVNRVRELPIGRQLGALDEALQGLSEQSPTEMSTSERRVMAMLLDSVMQETQALRAAVSR